MKLDTVINSNTGGQTPQPTNNQTINTTKVLTYIIGAAALYMVFIKK